MDDASRSASCLARGALQVAADDTFWKQESCDELEKSNDKDRNLESNQEEYLSSSQGRKKETTVFDVDALSDGSRRG